MGEEAVARGFARLTRLSPAGDVVLHTWPSQLILKHAVPGGEPDWQAETPEVKPVLGPKGRPRWFVREPDLLVEALGGRTMAGTTILPTDAPMRPWETGARAVPRVLRDLTPPQRRRSA